MREYANMQELSAEIEKAAKLFLAEFDDIKDEERNKMLEGVDRTPQQMIAYQLGWMRLLMSWDADERQGKKVITPSPDYKWNQLGKLYDSFYAVYAPCSFGEVKRQFQESVDDILVWLRTFSHDELFEQGGREWASSTPSKWPVWKWIHINTVSPFQSFRSKIRKWKRLNTTA